MTTTTCCASPRPSSPPAASGWCRRARRRWGDRCQELDITSFSSDSEKTTRYAGGFLSMICQNRLLS